ncbi:hypothetical protein BS47DRAFT_1402659 [Hydnum rufescens UP504]|uniref:Uncharacterized protein n=1 Tax=Hydnum rufescens UP504 TaxID=1448309 RepID=A0A9P6DLF8_9AGAM|nr:hypothetical protein BS47DRAFT_1402659 [Hydnum rufescens UP504]
MSELFVHLAPNEAAWADMLVKFLARRGHVFKAQDLLRQRFGSALAQYQVSVRVVDAEINKQISVACHEVLSHDPADWDNVALETIEPTTSTMNDLIEGSANEPTMSSLPLGSCSGPNPSVTPSDYLRSHCPLCFGAHNKAGDSKLPEFFLCLDACFAIRRNKDYDHHPGRKKQPGSQDPCIIPPGTHELPRSFLEAWKARVEAACPVKSHNRHTTCVSKKGEYAAHVADTEDDHVELGLHVPNLYLDSCGESFVAADGGRVKTPGGHFLDTGVMAGVCCHDRVIVWGNMWTPGKQQFYALAIIDFVMAQLPVDWQVGILYDVGCQIHRSALKWNLWVCQLWYHPRKSDGWGLTDGEGCEHLWSDLQCLIPNLHVAGFHHRLFLLDVQIEHLDHSKMCEAGVCNEYLQLQFKEQRAYQSRPLERQSKKKGFHTVEKILSVHHHLYIAQDLVDVLQKQLLSVPVSDTVASRNEIAEITSALVEQEKVVVRLSKQDDDLTAVLKLGDPMSYDNLMKMKEHPWFEHQLNMHALKAHIIAKACQKNFEMDNLTGAFRSKASMIKLRGQQRIPRNAVIPPPIDIKGLFNLDVDNDIWQDVGLADDEFEGKVLPWLGDEDVRNGIQLVQELTNCRDELSLCEQELYSLQLWFEEESAHSWQLWGLQR